jgi:hypothetical protein
MAETTKAFTLPVNHRKQEEKPPAVGDLELNKKGWVTREAIAVDREWGVWIDLSAEVTLLYPNQRPPGEGISVTKTNDGYIVGLDQSIRLENTPANVSFRGAGFEPVAHVMTH